MAENVGVIPGIKLLKKSLRVIVTFEELVPLATVGPVAVMVVFVASGNPGMNFTEIIEERVGFKTLRDLNSALVDLSVQVEFPSTSV